GLTLAAPLLGVSGGRQEFGASAPVMLDGGMWDGEVAVVEKLVEVELLVEGAAPPMEMPAPAVMGEQAAREEGKAGAAATTPAEAPRLRQLFGETMAWLPELVTEPDGTLQLDLPLYDNITTWRLTALAHSQDGRLGATTANLRVFQDFFVDFDLPYALTQHDEVSLPVAVYNYLEQPQSVRLQLEEEPWFELLDEAEKMLLIGASDVEVVYFRIRVTATQGRYRPTIWAYGERLSDATTATHDLLIRPDGKEFAETWSGRLTEQTRRTVEIPEAIIPGAAQVTVKIYPGVVSQVVEGMDALLQMPYGCFEQTTSATYPNVLVLDYMKSTEQTTPEIQLKAEEYINLGYQRLTTFEVPGGGFSLFGDNPPDRMLTAYGLMEFTDMARVYPVDADFIARAARWLLAQQAADGSWENDQGLVHESTWSDLGDDRVPVTAYISWALVHTGYGDESATQRGLAYVREHAHAVDDPYALALVANALVADASQDAFTRQILDRLAGLAQVDGDAVYWPIGSATMMGSEGETGSLETTALVAYALLKANAHPELANKALTYLIQAKDANGTWHSTQATILALKALLLSVTAGGEQSDAEVTVTVDGGRARTVTVTPENYDVVQILTFDDITPGRHEIELVVVGEGALTAQVTANYYLPWQELPPSTGREALDINVVYDRTALQVEDLVGIKVTATLNEPGTVEWALVDLGIPPGFTVLPQALEARIERDLALPVDYAGGRLKKFELTGRQVLVYLQDLQHGEPLTFEYQLRARFPVKAQAPASQAYDYYNPATRAEEAPVWLEVKE
ncbi:MAG: alpha-2-macroglobulin family protein, partial [Chloroflexota bacterium]|nr:alpha-2-macroglobulin family protein [Chloroflexota bacterium]